MEYMKYATDNRQALEKSSKCGCVYCCEQYYPIEIEEWSGDTAICPRCGIDAVIPNSLITDMRVKNRSRCINRFIGKIYTTVRESQYLIPAWRKHSDYFYTLSPP